jgi:hypothetical protein
MRTASSSYMGTYEFELFYVWEGIIIMLGLLFIRYFLGDVKHIPSSEHPLANNPAPFLHNSSMEKGRIVINSTSSQDSHTASSRKWCKESHKLYLYVR